MRLRLIRNNFPDITLFLLNVVTCNVMGYICAMIESIRHKGLRLFWERNNASKLPAAHVGKIRLILTLLNSVKSVEDANFPGSALHALRGEYAGFWAVKVTGNYRIIFRIENENVHDVDYLDYH